MCSCPAYIDVYRHSPYKRRLALYVFVWSVEILTLHPIRRKDAGPRICLSLSTSISFAFSVSLHVFLQLSRELQLYVRVYRQSICTMDIATT